MMNIKLMRCCHLALLSGAFLLPSGFAFAYGPEGMFGGRPQPDSTYTLNSQIDRDDRPNRAESVLQKPRPDYDPVPVSLGSFDFYPSLETVLTYDSNYFSTSANRDADGILNFRPIIYGASNWNRHAVTMTAFGDFSKLKDNDEQDFNGAVTQISGRYDIAAQTWLSGQAGYQHLKQPFTSANNISGNQKTVFDVYQVGLSGYRGAGILSLNAGYNFERLDYNSLTITGSSFNPEQNNRNKHLASTQLTYNMTENLKPYVRGAYNWRKYDSTTARDSDGYEATAGVLADFGGITSMEAYIGWISQDYSKAVANKINQGVKFGGRLEWNVTGLTSLVLESNRTVEETSLTGLNSYLASGGSATLTHELLRNVLVETNVAFTRSDYEGSTTRQDDDLVAGAGTRWFINRHLYSDVVYSWGRRESSQDNADYIKHVVSWRVGVQL